jgi:hypothetical protein
LHLEQIMYCFVEINKNQPVKNLIFCMLLLIPSLLCAQSSDRLFASLNSTIKGEDQITISETPDSAVKFNIEPGVANPLVNLQVSKNVSTNFYKLNFKENGSNLELQTIFDGITRVNCAYSNEKGEEISNEEFKMPLGPQYKIIDTSKIPSNVFYVTATVKSMSTNTACVFYFKIGKH